jgi:hypothetical protein
VEWERVEESEGRRLRSAPAWAAGEEEGEEKHVLMVEGGEEGGSNPDERDSDLGLVEPRRASWVVT